MPARCTALSLKECERDSSIRNARRWCVPRASGLSRCPRCPQDIIRPLTLNDRCRNNCRQISFILGPFAGRAADAAGIRPLSIAPYTATVRGSLVVGSATLLWSATRLERRIYRVRRKTFWGIRFSQCGCSLGATAATMSLSGLFSFIIVHDYEVWLNSQSNSSSAFGFPSHTCLCFQAV